MRIAALTCLLCAVRLLAQDENSLRRAFEGRNVRVKMDMPAASSGVDINWRKDPPLDFRSYSQRIKQFGVSLHSGDVAMVTTLRVKGKNIEFQLAGGGYGTARDDKGSVSAPSVPKSNREADLEKQIDREQDRDRRDRLKSELARAQDQRRNEEARLQERAREEEYERKREIEVKRLGAGSRFNIWFPENRLKESVPSPDEIMQILGEWVDFSPMTAGGAAPSPVTMNPPPARSYPPPALSAPLGDRLRRGMSIDQVHDMLGPPLSSRESRQPDLTTLSETWESADDRTEVLFVNGTVVKYSVISK